MFYFDNNLQFYEANYQWDQSLIYLEKCYEERKDSEILCSLVGFSWLYFMEGPVISKMYAEDPNVLALSYWKKYVDVGMLEAYEDPSFNFIAGYSLSLHGYLIDETYEKKGTQLIKNCVHLSRHDTVWKIVTNFINNEKSKKYTPVDNGFEICEQLFNGTSLLDGYFRNVYIS